MKLFAIIILEAINALSLCTPNRFTNLISKHLSFAHHYDFDIIGS